MPTTRDTQRAFGRAVVDGGSERDDAGRCGRSFETRRGVQRGRVRRRARRRARRIPLPRRRARRDAAHDRSDARELLMALAVTELVAAVPPLVARVRPAAAAAVVATRSTDAAAPATAPAARRVAVEDVARSAAAERRVVGLPPTGRYRSGRARVLAVVHRAAEHGPTRSAVGRRAAHRGVRGTRPQQVPQRVGRERGADDRRLHEEAAAARSPAEPRAHVAHDAFRERHLRRRRDHRTISRPSSTTLTSPTMRGRYARLPATT